MPHRLFFGLKPPSELRDQLLDFMHGIDNARWQDDDQLHLTLRYIGEVDVHRADDLAEAAESVRFLPFELTVNGFDVFQRKGVPRLLYAGMLPSEPLRHLQRRLERVCQSCGIEPEHRKFHPHITLARLNSSTGPVHAFFRRKNATLRGQWVVNTFILYESFLQENGSLYVPAVTYLARS